MSWFYGDCRSGTSFLELKETAGVTERFHSHRMMKIGKKRRFWLQLAVLRREPGLGFGAEMAPS